MKFDRKQSPMVLSQVCLFGADAPRGESGTAPHTLVPDGYQFAKSSSPDPLHGLKTKCI